LPTYGYQCNQCKHEFSVFQSMKDDPVGICPECSGSVKRLLYPVGIVFKGSGWYVNDSRKPEPAESGAPATADAKNGDGKSGDATPETKSDTKTESAPAPKPDTAATPAGSK
jgi:putative FmdB family regulatory protein